MKLHSKTISILVGTLLIGIAIGALGWSTIHNRRAEQLREMRRQGGLYGSIDRYIDPVDSLQEGRLRDLSSAYQDTLSRFWRHFLWHRTELMKDFEEDLLQELNTVQQENIRPYLDRMTTMPDYARRDSTRKAESDSSETSPVSNDSTSTN
ncbi:MAG: hypothetical protein OXT73_06820 [Bacteroidota bacterium]|nr:hypothetical protein [Bacteroidota bacterium]